MEKMDSDNAASSLTPPAAKKWKQARLPFQILASRPAAASPNIEPKKRKLSEGATGPLKPPKTPKSSEKQAKKPETKKPEQVDHEVSSSSEADVIIIDENRSPEKGKSAKVGLMDKFIAPTQKAEVSTSGDVVDSLSDPEDDEDDDEDDEDDDEGSVTAESVESFKECSVFLSPCDAKVCSKSDDDLPPSTPTTSRRGKAKTPGSSKEKEELRLKKKEEREKLKAERQKLKEEKEKQRIEEKEKKETERKEAKEKKEKEKQEKQEQLQKEKQEKLKVKEEERRKKQEAIDAKNEQDWSNLQLNDSVILSISEVYPQNKGLSLLCKLVSV
eukprot:GHVO01011886.1.p1 GENE.GHVO01011886.1~~GHVO01011886.1.p1  ORF type:complete len:329 (-),score=79.28 GHVO01011886.1:795-1781(-)